MLYLSMAAYFESKTLKGFAKWMVVQAEEEKGHAMKIYEYIVEAGGRARFDAIEAPKSDWKLPLDVFSHAYEHEKKVTGLINTLVEADSQGEGSCHSQYAPLVCQGTGRGRGPDAGNRREAEDDWRYDALSSPVRSRTGETRVTFFLHFLRPVSLVIDYIS